MLIVAEKQNKSLFLYWLILFNIETSKNYQEITVNLRYNGCILLKGVDFMDYHSEVLHSITYIEKNLEKTISLDELAQTVHLSKYHYHRIFHKIAGESVSKYINRRRMEKAAEELVRTDEPIINIALKYQYGSQEAFSRAFQHIHGITPGRYRRANMENKGNPVIGLNMFYKNIKNIAA